MPKTTTSTGAKSKDSTPTCAKSMPTSGQVLTQLLSSQQRSANYRTDHANYMREWRKQQVLQGLEELESLQASLGEQIWPYPQSLQSTWPLVEEALWCWYPKGLSKLYNTPVKVMTAGE